MSAAAATARPLSVEARREIGGGAGSALMKRAFSRFVIGAWTQVEGNRLEWNFALQGLCDHLQAFVEGWLVANGKGTKRQREAVAAHWAAHGLTPQEGRVLVQNLIVNMPPGTLKSRLIMVFLPAWIWLHDPTFSFLCTSSNDENVRRDSEAHQGLVTSAWYRETFGIAWTLSRKSKSVKKWTITAGGYRISRTMLGGIVGLHVDGIFVDDADDPLRVFNEPERRKVHGKWDGVMDSRVNHEERSLRIVAQQRVHAEDLSGHLLATMRWLPDTETSRLGWARFAVPMQGGKGPRDLGALPFKYSDPRNDNAVIDPKRFGDAVLSSKKTKLGSWGFEAQYNQNPEAIDGGWFSRAWFRFFTIELRPGQERDDELRRRPDGCRQRPGQGEGKLPEDETHILGRLPNGQLDLDFLTITVDASFGSTNEKTASNVGLLVIGGKGILRYVFCDRSRPMSFLDTLASIRALIAEFPARRVLIEFKANGPAVIETLTKEMRDGELIGPDGEPVSVVIDDFDPGKNTKAARARAILPEFEAGVVYLLDGASWLEDFLKEVCVFPHAKRDDRIDALSQAILYHSVANTNLEATRAMSVW